jgi:hypothetical protein
VPKPRANAVRYHGVFAPAATWRPAIVPGPELPAAGIEAVVKEASVSELLPAETTEEIARLEPIERHPRNYAWAELMRRVWEFDVLACPCGGRLRILSAIHPPETTRKILECMGLPSRPPPIAPTRWEPHLDLGTPKLRRCSENRAEPSPSFVSHAAPRSMATIRESRLNGS